MENKTKDINWDNFVKKADENLKNKGKVDFSNESENMKLISKKSELWK